jgi:diketogulonate reductase-like aldo/keto reductase
LFFSPPERTFLHQPSLLSYCAAQGIAVEAYSPLTKGLRLADPRVVEVARRHGRSAAQVLIRWSLQHDMIVIPENASVYDFSLSPEDMRQLDGLNEDLYTGWDPRDVR